MAPMQGHARRRDDPIRVLIVDDDTRIVETLELWIDAEPDIEIVGTAYDGPSGLALAERVEADVIMVDVNLPGMLPGGASRSSRRPPQMRT